MNDIDAAFLFDKDYLTPGKFYGLVRDGLPKKEYEVKRGVMQAVVIPRACTTELVSAVAGLFHKDPAKVCISYFDETVVGAAKNSRVIKMKLMVLKRNADLFTLDTQPYSSTAEPADEEQEARFKKFELALIRGALRHVKSVMRKDLVPIVVQDLSNYSMLAQWISFSKTLDPEK